MGLRTMQLLVVLLPWGSCLLTSKGFNRCRSTCSLVPSHLLQLHTQILVTVSYNDIILCPGVLVDLDHGSVTFASDGAWGNNWKPHITQEDMPCHLAQRIQMIQVLGARRNFKCWQGWLVVWTMTFIFPYIGNDIPN